MKVVRVSRHGKVRVFGILGLIRYSFRVLGLGVIGFR